MGLEKGLFGPRPFLLALDLLLHMVASSALCTPLYCVIHEHMHVCAHTQHTYTHTHGSTQPSTRDLGAYIYLVVTFPLDLAWDCLSGPIAPLKVTTVGKSIHQSLGWSKGIRLVGVQ